MSEPTIAFDDNGHLRVKSARISKAGIAPYKGSELRELKALAPAKFYQVLRSASELKKAAKSFNGVPLLRDHGEAVEIGRTGNNAAFDGKYIVVDLCIHDPDAIDDIVSGRARQLSIGYDYALKHEKGVSADYGRFEKIMHDIRGHHVALVDVTRGGPECSIPVIEPERENPMTTTYVHPRAREFFRPSPMALDAASSNSPLLNAAHEEDETINTLVALCQKKLRPEQMLALCEKLQAHLEGQPAERPAGKQAMDSNYRNPRPTKLSTAEVKAFAERVRVDTMGVQPQPKPPTPSPAATSNFNARYPDAKKIKIS